MHGVQKKHSTVIGMTYYILYWPLKAEVTHQALPCCVLRAFELESLNQRLFRVLGLGLRIHGLYCYFYYYHDYYCCYYFYFDFNYYCHSVSTDGCLALSLGSSRSLSSLNFASGSPHNRSVHFPDSWEDLESRTPNLVPYTTIG